MNYIDFFVIALIIIFVMIGYRSGLIKSFFRITSGVMSLIIAIKFYPSFSQLMLKTAFFENIKDKLNINILKSIPDVQLQTRGEIETIILDNMSIPGQFKEMILSNFPENITLIDSIKIADMISTSITTIIIQILSVILLFFIAKIGLVIIRMILESCSKLPIIRHVNKFIGALLGGVEGMLTIYIILGVMRLFNTHAINVVVDSSIVAKIFYENNFIINLLL